jgi:fatty-acyl-CoA synthase
VKKKLVNRLEYPILSEIDSFHESVQAEGASMSQPVRTSAIAYEYPLLIKQLFLAPVIEQPDQEIVYRDRQRFTYRQFQDRVRRLASGLKSLGIKPGDTVAMMEWDSHRYLESYYAVPMIGAVLHTINVRLSLEQLIYTIDHAEDDIILVNAEFLPVLEQIKGRIDNVKQFILINDTETTPACSIPFADEYEHLLANSEPLEEFPDFDENTRATTFYTTGTTGLPKGVFFSHRQLVLHTLATTASLSSTASTCRFHREDVYMPLTPMFHVHAWGLPISPRCWALNRFIPADTRRTCCLDCWQRKRSPSAIVCRPF